MIVRNKKNYCILKKFLRVTQCISIRFSDTKTANVKKYRDTACTTMIRCLTKNIPTYIDRKSGQLCPGGNYFLNISHASKSELHDTYITKERIFQNKKACDDFIKNIPPYPQVARTRYILFTPLIMEEKRPDVIMMLANPAQAGRIVGLSVRKKMSQPTILPALSTCASIYAPLASRGIHINLIDYFDRYYQGTQHGRLLWKDSHMIISMPVEIFEEIVQAIPLSAHGAYVPTIKPKKFDRI